VENDNENQNLSKKEWFKARAVEKRGSYLLKKLKKK